LASKPGDDRRLGLGAGRFLVLAVLGRDLAVPPARPRVERFEVVVLLAIPHTVVGLSHESQQPQ
jgi:hypothetical protein